MKASSWHLLLTLVVLQTLNLTYSQSKNELKKRYTFENEDKLLLKSGSICNDSSTGPLIKLMNFIAVHYLSTCMTVFLYDEFFHTSLSLQPVITQLLRMLPGPLIHGQFTTELLADNLQAQAMIKQQETLCTNFIVLTQTLEPVVELLGPQPQSKVVLIPLASQWKIDNFLESPVSNQLLNLLIIVDPMLQHNSWFSEGDELKVDINMYTHKLYATAMGTSVPHVVAAWRCGQLTRPIINLFPTKITSLNGYQLQVVATEQPPYVYQRNIFNTAGDSESHWDGLEIRLIKLISSQLNYTIKWKQPSHRLESTSRSVLADLTTKKADIATAGLYITTSTLQQYSKSAVHSHDCAVFMTLTSTALPKYRAIMGPFHWEVWMLVTLAYIFAILPISFSVHHSLRILLHEPYELENMFWYVFGTFTNCFTFSGKKSWIQGKMASTRMFIGTYWAFSIIVSAAYSGSIIAFIMLPIFPEVIETTQQLVEEDFKLVVTNNSDLTQALYNSTDTTIQKLAKTLKIVKSVDEGITNVTDATFFTHYAFLHHREFLKHVIRTKYTLKSSHKKSVFHLSQKCFVPKLVAMMFPKGSVLVDRFNGLLMKASEGGFMNKLVTDVAWDQQRSGSGKLLQVSKGSGIGLKSQPAEDKQLTLDDTQGMFLLLGAGFTIALAAFFAECSVFWWQKYFNNLIEKLPTITYSEQGKSIESNQDVLNGQDGFWHYFGSSTNNSVFQSKTLIHVEITRRQEVLLSRSLSVLPPESYEIKKRNPSV